MGLEIRKTTVLKIMKNVLAEKKFLIHFGKSDPQGFLYHARLAEMAHELLEEFWSQHKLGWGFWFQNTQWAVPLRHAECEFLAPMRVGQECAATLQVKKFGDSSVQFLCEFYAPGPNTPVLAARTTTTHVFVRREDFRKISVPETVREALALN
jgi:acyl-CoA thioesterase FadM